jgi:integrase/recombinase XerC/integrase/recombinase XerD
MGTVRKLRQAEGVRLADAIDLYLTTEQGRAENKGTHRVYGQVLGALRQQFGGDTDVAELTAAAVAEWFTARWDVTAASTWNVARQVLLSAAGWWKDQGWITASPVAMISYRKLPPDRDRALTRAQIERLLTDEKIPLRERLLWRMLYETAARSAEVLRLDVQDLDMPNRSARVTRKGGAVDVIGWQTGTARLLPRYLQGRKTGPVFITEQRQPSSGKHARALTDLAEDGHARLSYERAAALFKAAAKGATLHQLRHSALSHAAEDGANVPMLMARSGHSSVRSLTKYARVSPEAMLRHLAETDPARRG